MKDLSILQNKDLFEQTHQCWNYVLINTSFRYNTIRDCWTGEPRQKSMHFESVFDLIMNDDKIKNETKEQILFNLAELKRLPNASWELLYPENYK